jgi:hypothetical protein
MKAISAVVLLSFYAVAFIALLVTLARVTSMAGWGVLASVPPPTPLFCARASRTPSPVKWLHAQNANTTYTFMLLGLYLQGVS